MLDDSFDPVLDAGLDPGQLVTGLRNFVSMRQLRKSEFYRDHREKLRTLFGQPRISERPGCRPRLGSFLRVVAWNILYGTELEGIIHILNEHPVLRYADLIFLNEVDYGMGRSGLKDVATEIGCAIDAHALFGIEYLELADAHAASLPSVGLAPLHGNAILTRLPFSNARIVRLPRCENNFESIEKRLGGRSGLVVEVELGGMRLTAATAHLDVVNTPRCRQTQIRELLAEIEAAAGTSKPPPAILGGDFNTHTFSRGGKLRAIGNLLRILSHDREQLQRCLLDPATREPALLELHRFGYLTEGFNDGLPTNRAATAELDKMNVLPGPVRRWALKKLGGPGFGLEFRLDWLAGRYLRPLLGSELVDDGTGVQSIQATTVQYLEHKGRSLSDHSPIVADVVVEPGAQVI
ncbi:MAG TPA: endonuclease/exonuclease/phosphatase family protein [Blastocatellia bacterium]|nr:endonuclease/exonuclease/phosphatase family protein [Blastocatellia bacterium]